MEGSRFDTLRTPLARHLKTQSARAAAARGSRGRLATARPSRRPSRAAAASGPRPHAAAGVESNPTPPAAARTAGAGEPVSRRLAAAAAAVWSASAAAPSRRETAARAAGAAGRRERRIWAAADLVFGVAGADSDGLRIVSPHWIAGNIHPSIHPPILLSNRYTI
jgi:hypothetical protein